MGALSTVSFKEMPLATGSKLVTSSKEFRSDINGLRAWAVVSVVLYHFGVPGVQGGFVGVDVFFVISGFLMSGIILNGMEAGRFSLWRFYWARARRIIPALVVLCAAVLCLGWFLLMSSEYQALGRHARDSLFFTSNLQYLSESGYFDSDSHEKWLLHTWSLSVEWQFYLLFPLLLLLVGKIFNAPRAFVAAVIALFAASLFWCLVLTYNQPDAAFFKLESRAWEMLAGAALFVCRVSLGTQIQRRVASGLGLVLIAASVVIFTPESLWPGWGAALPVAGAVLVLLARDEDSIWTSSGLAQWLGDRSYSIYLWHWPVVVSLAYFGVDEQYFWMLLGVLISLGLGHFSYLLVEVPSRNFLSRKNADFRGFLWLSFLAVTVMVASQYVRKTGVVDRLPEEVRAVDSARLDVNPRREECQDARASCIYGGDQLEIIVVGDSHADTIVTAVMDSLDEPAGVLYKGESGCLVMHGAKRTKEHKDCERLNRWVLEELPGVLPGKPVLLVNALSGYALGSGDSYENVGRPSVYFQQEYLLSSARFREEFRQGYIDTACRIAQAHPLYVMRPLPEMPGHVPNVIGRAMLRGSSIEIHQTLQDYRKRNDFIWSLQDEAAEKCGVTILDPLPYLCGDGRCAGAKDGVLYYSDTDHLTQSGNRRLIPLFSDAFKQNKDL